MLIINLLNLKQTINNSSIHDTKERLQASEMQLAVADTIK
jgi:hypothetical protein